MNFKNAQQRLNSTGQKNNSENTHARFFSPNMDAVKVWNDIFPQNERGEIIFRDPRPDLDSEQHEGFYWGLLIAYAFDLSRDLAGSLHGFRCMGCRLINDNGWKIQPGAEWTPEEYQAARDRYLVPFKPQIVKLLSSL